MYKFDYNKGKYTLKISNNFYYNSKTSEPLHSKNQMKDTIILNSI